MEYLFSKLMPSRYRFKVFVLLVVWFAIVFSIGSALESSFLSPPHRTNGTDAGGIEGLGPALAGNEFVAVQSDDDLVGFLTVGRGTDDSANTTGVVMPPRGGNPSLTDDDLYDVVAYLRTLR